MRQIFTTVVALLPPSALKRTLLRRLGWRIGRRVHIGCVLVFRVSGVQLGDDVRLGHFSVFRGLAALVVADRGRIGQWNWISASPDLIRAGGSGSLHVGRDSAITSRHYLDCSGGIKVGRFTTCAGVRSTMITHGIDWKSSSQRTRSIAIGDYCLVSSNVQIAPGTVVQDRTVVGMGTTISGEVGPGLVIGSRGEGIRSLVGDYFHREIGYVQPQCRNDSSDPSERGSQ